MLNRRDEIEKSVRERFAIVAIDPSSERKLAVGPDSVKRLGYAASEVDALPQTVTESFIGVGNPLSLGRLKAGDVVLDLGCGAGFDSFLASRRVGTTGKVIGVDFSPEMIAKARASAAVIEVRNVSFQLGQADRLPLPPESVDVVITNGVFNLCVDKRTVAKEMRRVLKPGGALQMADILLESHVTPEDVAAKGEWSD